jgi:hypothetical protein
MVPCWLGHLPFRHCDIPTRSIRHCNDSPHKCLHIVTIRPHWGWTVRPPPNLSVWPLRSGSKRWLWQSNPRIIWPILCSAQRGKEGQFGPRHTDGAVKKRRCATGENFTDAWISRAQAWPNLTPTTPPNRALPRYRSVVSCWVGSTIPRVRLDQRMRTTLHAAVVSHFQEGLIVTIQMAYAGWIITVWIRPLRKHPFSWMKNLESYRIAEVVSHGCSITGGQNITVSDGVGQSVTGSNWGVA